MRTLLIYLFILLPAFGFDTRVQGTKWVITNGCSLKVDGSTNINNFSCEITNYANPDTIVVSRNNNQPIQLSGNIKLDVQNFNCHNPVMTADLRKTLKVKQFPKVMIYFVSMNKYPDFASKQEIKGVVVIVLAGVSKRLEVDYKVIAADKNFIHMVGSRKINFSDFDITPPRKLGGMIQTNNELSVVFTLKMKVLN
jgi:hypothetical protein